MSAPLPTRLEEPLVAWLGPARPERLPGVRLVAPATLEELARLSELPSVVVLREGACEWSLDDCLMQAAAPALVSLSVVVVAEAWSSRLTWRGAQAGAFCCLASDAALEELAAAVLAAAEQATSRRRRLRPPHDLRAAGSCLESARFHFRTLGEAETLSVLLSAAMPSPERRMGGVLELLINAVEHGNLGVGFLEKRELLLSGRLHGELERRLSLDPWARRQATVTLGTDGRTVHLMVEDEGEGFDFASVLSRVPDLTAPHGRGIFLARAMSFDRLRYEGRGNRVIAEVDLP
ncbi:MAG: ATP-binding protein [Myxococcaceae bacterium]|nr:ATP-binding protein [Myxococcaceae bacterium]